METKQIRDWHRKRIQKIIRKEKLYTEDEIKTLTSAEYGALRRIVYKLQYKY